MSTTQDAPDHRHAPTHPAYPYNECAFGTPPYIVGLDFGQARDYSALAVLQVDLDGGEPPFRLLHLHRYPNGTFYSEIIDHVYALMRTAPLHPTCLLVPDQTGVGQGIVEELRRKHVANLSPIVITSGRQFAFNGTGFNVPKVDLVTALQLVFENRQIAIAGDIPHARDLRRELMNFRHVLGPGGASAAAASGEHDDLVMALAMALWHGLRRKRQMETYLKAEYEAGCYAGDGLCGGYLDPNVTDPKWDEDGRWIGDDVYGDDAYGNDAFGEQAGGDLGEACFDGELPYSDLDADWVVTRGGQCFSGAELSRAAGYYSNYPGDRCI